MLDALHQTESRPRQRKLIVDDDVRNIFMPSGMLERHHVIQVMYAERKQRMALPSSPKTHPTLISSLMDVMMPEMDGTRTIRRHSSAPRQFHMIALAATSRRSPEMYRNEDCIRLYH